MVPALVLTACAGAVDGSSTTTTTRPLVPTARPAPTTAPLPTIASVPTSSTAPATAAPTTALAATTTLAPSPTLLGPSPNLVTLVETPRATRQEPAPAGEQALGAGVLVEATNPAYDRAFLVSLFAGQLGGVLAAPGWSLRTVARDAQWTPTVLAAAPHAFVGRRWLVYVDSPRTDRQQVVAVDVVTGAMASYLETPLRAHWFAVVDDLDDHSVGLLFDPSPADPTADPAVADIRDRLAVRRLDLRTGRATDTELRLPNGYTYRDAWFDGSGGVVVATTSGDEQLRGATGQPLRAVDPTTPGPEPTVDGVRLDRSGDPALDVPVRDANGAVIAQVFPWRLQGDAASIGLFGWSAGRGWFGAVRNAPDGGMPPHPGPGVYDVATASWDWVVAQDSPAFAAGLRQLVVGTVARGPS